jgi:hypothetical protein
MAYNYPRVQGTADRLIKKYGREARLRRSTGDRKVMCVLINYDAQERRNEMIQHADQKAIMSAVGLKLPPDPEEDALIIGASAKFIAPFEKWRIVAPPTKLDPAGTVVYWEVQVRK